MHEPSRDDGHGGGYGDPYGGMSQLMGYGGGMGGQMGYDPYMYQGQPMMQGM
jgi:hypothetical protein